MNKRLLAGLALFIVATVQAGIDHPDVTPLDRRGLSLMDTPGLLSEASSCRECHDADHIATTLSTSHRSLPQALTMGDVLRDRLAGINGQGGSSNDIPGENISDIPCSSCHGGPWTYTASGHIDGSSILSGSSIAGCASCHGDIVLDTASTAVIGNALAPADLGALSGSISSGQRVSASTLNVTDKARRNEPFDIHLSRGMVCSDCHRGATRPGDKLRLFQDTQAHLLRDPRSVDIGEYLQQPDHNMSDTLQCRDCHVPENGHDWLPFRTRHQSRLACESCHIPNPLGQALDAFDVDRASGTIRGRNEQGLVAGYTPLLLDDGQRLAPFNLIRLRGDSLQGEPLLPVPVAHGVVRNAALRECSLCHRPEGLTQGTISVGDGAFPPSLLNLDFPGYASLLIEEPLEGSFRVRAVPDKGGFYILGADQVSWADRLGMLIAAATLAGVLAHGAARYLAYRRRTEHVEPQERVYMYGVYERFWHWLQAVAILSLLVTGAAIHKPYLFPFLNFAYMVELHNLVGFILLINAALAAFYHVASGEVKQYLPGTHDLFGRMFAQSRYYVQGIFRGDPHPFAKDPEHKLNPLQQITYFGLLNTLLPAQIITGLLIWGAQRWPNLANDLGGLMLLGPLHSLMAWLFAAFLIMHIYLTTTSGPQPHSGIKAMLEGWEDIERPTGGNT